ncbi:MAG: histidine kinase [Chloroflexi bacterium]|nr:histidine kinase [Chloroflexota bacterium]
MPAPHPLARRIHDRVLQLLGTALLETEMCEQLAQLGRGDEIGQKLAELRTTLEATVDELRSIMADLRTVSAENASLREHAA